MKSLIEGGEGAVGEKQQFSQIQDSSSNNRSLSLRIVRIQRADAENQWHDLLSATDYPEGKDSVNSEDEQAVNLAEIYETVNRPDPETSKAKIEP